MSYRPPFAIAELDAERLTILTNALARLNAVCLRRRPGRLRLYASGLQYRDDSRMECRVREGLGHVFQESPWSDLDAAHAAGGGDCKVLVAIRIAEEWAEGRRPAPLPRRRPTGRAVWVCPTCGERRRPASALWHVQLVHENGSIEDPSRHLGMREPGEGDDAMIPPDQQAGVVRAGRGDVDGHRSCGHIPDCPPQAGPPGSPGYRWCYVVRPGDTAQSIAAAIAGTSNVAHMLHIENPAAVFCPGERLHVPSAWNARISTSGEVRP